MVKYGTGVTLEEHAAQQCAGELGVPVARLIRGRPTEHGGMVYIWMDYVKGHLLKDVWRKMTTDDKKEIAKDLGGILRNMRRNESPGGWIQACNGGAVRDLRVIKDYKGGPFERETSFNEFLLDLYPNTPEADRKSLADGLRSDHRIVFTHGDLSTRNIIVHKDKKKYKIKALIDWEYGGWYPEYWEYVKFMNHDATGTRDWKDYVEDIFPEKQYKHELNAYRALGPYRRG